MLYFLVTLGAFIFWLIVCFIIYKIRIINYKPSISNVYFPTEEEKASVNDNAQSKLFEQLNAPLYAQLESNLWDQLSNKIEN